MNIVDQIRRTLRDSGVPMTLAQMADANSWSKEDRTQASKSILPMKARGEVHAVIDNGKAAYELVQGFQARAPGQRGKTLPKKSVAPASTVERPIVDENQAPLFTQEAAPVPPDAPADQSLRSFLAHRLRIIGDTAEQLLAVAIDADVDKAVLKQILSASRELRSAGVAIA